MNYPSGIIKHQKAYINYGNRGMTLESDLNETNTYYLINNIAVVYKKPTPITITKVDYRSRTDAVIKEAYFKTPSTTDYNGIYKGKYIDFEAKETKKDYFPLSNIHPHQINHLRQISKHGGIAFIIVRFTKKNETYYLSFDKLDYFLKNYNRKSIPNSYFKSNGTPILDKYNPRVDYISVINKFIKGEDENEKIVKK